MNDTLCRGMLRLPKHGPIWIQYVFAMHVRLLLKSLLFRALELYRRLGHPYVGYRIISSRLTWTQMFDFQDKLRRFVDMAVITIPVDMRWKFWFELGKVWWST